MNEGFLTVKHIDIGVTTKVHTAKSPYKVSYETLLALKTIHISLGLYGVYRYTALQ